MKVRRYPITVLRYLQDMRKAKKAEAVAAPVVADKKSRKSNNPKSEENG